MKKITVELTVDQWRLDQDVDNADWYPDAIFAEVEREINEYLFDSLVESLREFIPNNTWTRAKREIKLTLSASLNAITEAEHLGRLDESHDEVMGLMQQVLDQAKTQ